MMERESIGERIQCQLKDIKIRQDETFVSDSWTSSSLSSPRTHLNKGFNRRLMSRDVKEKC